MLKLLVGLGLFMYAFLMIAGTDDGQQRAGLREVPEDQTQTVSVSAPVPEEPVLRAAATELVPMLPAPPIQVMLPKPEAAPSQASVALTQAPAAQDAMVQTLLDQSGETATMTFAPAPDSLTGTALAEGTVLRWVAVERANVRSAASKTAPVTARIEQGEAVAVLWTDPSGWARVRVEGDGLDGYVHESLLTELNPQFQ